MDSENETLSGAEQGSQQHTEGANGVQRTEATETMDMVPPYAPLRRYLTAVIGKTSEFQHTIQQKLHEVLPDLQEVQTIEDCDFLLVFCTGSTFKFTFSTFSRRSYPERLTGPTIETAREMLPHRPDTKPTLIVVIKQLGSEPSVSDSSNYENSKDTISVECLFQKDHGLLESSHNDRALSRVLSWLMEERSPESSADMAKCDSLPQVVAETQKSIPRIDTNNTQTTNSQTTNTQTTNTQTTNTQTAPINPSRIIKFFTCLSGNTLNAHKDFLMRLHDRIPGLTEVHTEDKSDVILVFCPIVSRAGTDISAAMGRLTSLSVTKTAVLVVLYHTFDPEFVLTDNSSWLTRGNMICVNCLFYEQNGLLSCFRNKVALNTVANFLYPEGLTPTTPKLLSTLKIPEVELTTFKPRPPKPDVDVPGSEMDVDKPESKMNWFLSRLSSNSSKSKTKIKFLTCVTGKLLKVHNEFVQNLQKQISDLQEVETVDECDFILGFCTVVSTPEIDIKAALKQLMVVSDSKPAVLVALHHTFDPEHNVPDGKRYVDRVNTITAGFLFYEDEGLLKCMRNDEAFSTIAQWIESQNAKKRKKIK